ncbi:4'-phosphopantetheinyl transferase superfamily protein [Rahnella sp. SL6]|uniref:4'-phosphopantetheinyl transferase family protein n=1 Tax=Rahnella perminowiae TaxID=2816244 RepID=UPI001C275E02|nr:4'-phosphopantetheinyl transferase superfamily protein [Rahnella perminowiae]MBU9810667.1 4'-phosphopantetheinyl transferase superfamily protein [Rahnella perminowiae]
MIEPVAGLPSIYRCDPLPELRAGEGLCLLHHFEYSRPEQSLRERAQCWLRQVLANCLSVTDEQLIIARTPQDKPWLPGAPWLHFNLSHSGASAAIVLCSGTEVGVDLERISGKVEVKKAIARRFFHPDEQRWLAEDEEHYLVRFTRLWSIKEAWLKARGTGLTQSLASFCALPQNNATADVLDEHTGERGVLHHAVIENDGFYCLAYGACQTRKDLPVRWQVCLHRTGN